MEYNNCSSKQKKHLQKPCNNVISEMLSYQPLGDSKLKTTDKTFIEQKATEVKYKSIVITRSKQNTIRAAPI